MFEARNKPNSGCGCNSGQEAVAVDLEARNKPNSGCGCNCEIVLLEADGTGMAMVSFDGGTPMVVPAAQLVEMVAQMA